MNIGIVGDTHIPFEKKGYLDFCYETFIKYKVDTVVHIGDLVDFHSISTHWDADPDGFSPKEELDKSRKRLLSWYKAFPKVQVMIGNHDERLMRAAIKHGLSAHYFRELPELFGFPKGWDYSFDCYRHGVRFFHGMGFGGQYAHIRASVEHGQSVVMGHIHSNFGVAYSASEKNLVFGLAVGCGIDRHTYAFKYGRDFRRKPIIGCGVVVENGKVAHAIPMDLE
jgi:predicted phosphodiesterase